MELARKEGGFSVPDRELSDTGSFFFWSAQTRWERVEGVPRKVRTRWGTW
jgi:hypothetical protein